MDSLNALLEDVRTAFAEKRGVDANRATADIATLAEQTEGERDIALFASLALHPDTGLLVFLRDAAGQEIFDLAKENVLNTLTTLIPLLGQRVLPYITEIKNVCVSIYTRDKAARCKTASFGPLIELLSLHDLFTANTMGQLARDLAVPKLIEKYMDILVGPPSKTSSTVRMHALHLLGLLSERFPGEMAGRDAMLLNVFMGSLQQEMNKQDKKPDMSLIAGALRGLTSFLVHFTQPFEDGLGPNAPARQIFKYTILAIGAASSGELKRYEVPRAGLKLLAQHAGQYRELLAQSFESVYRSVSELCRHKNKDVKTVAFLALETFLKEMSAYITGRGREDRNARSMFSFLFSEFHTKLEAPESTPREISIAIRGYGYLAAPCRMLLPEAELKILFRDLARRCDHIYLNATDLSEETLAHLPSFVDAVANIVGAVDQPPSMFLATLERLALVLFSNYPALQTPSQRASAQYAFARIMLALATKDGALQLFFGNFAFQGLLRVCSRDPTNEDELRYIKDYATLFANLFQDYAYRTLQGADFTEENVAIIFKTMYDEFIRAVLRLMHKLNFTPQPLADDADSAADPTAGVTFQNPKDIQVFSTLIFLVHDFLLRTRCEYFTAWVSPAILDTIEFSTKYPLIAGFYSLLETFLKLTHRIEFRATRAAEESAPGEQAAQVTPVLTPELSTVLEKFLLELLLLLQQFKDGLLATALRVVLVAPVAVVRANFPRFAEAMRAALLAGLGNAPLAHAAIDALERWVVEVPPAEAQPALPAILAALDSYLTSNQVLDIDTVEGAASVRDSTQVTANKPKRRAAVAAPKGSAETDSPDSLDTLKTRIVHVLGSMGGVGAGGLVAPPQTGTPPWLAWDSRTHLTYGLPLRDARLDVVLDQLLPRVLVLTRDASQRRLKVAACELFHSLFLFMLGRTSHQTGLAPLWAKVLPAALLLACDSEPVASQLFEPLVMQTVRWFTRATSQNWDTAKLLDALFEGLASNDSAALRDLCAKCIAEYFAWTIKHAPDVNAANRGVRVLLKRIYSCAQHPSPSTRLGAALAFNSIYRQFREQDVLVEQYILEMAVVMLASLQRAHTDDPALGTARMAAQSVKHIQRILLKTAPKLEVDRKDRTVPPGWDVRRLRPVLASFVQYVFELAACVETEARHAAMALFCALTAGRGRSVVDAYAGMGLLVATGENLTVPYAQPGSRQLVQWLQQAEAMLDFYIWLVGERLVDTRAALTHTTSQLWNAVIHFVLFLSEPRHNADSTPAERAALHVRTATVCVRTLELLALDIALVPGKVWTSDTFKFVALALCCPQRLGFDWTNMEVSSSLPPVTARLLAAIKTLSPDLVARFVTLVAQLLAEHQLDVAPTAVTAHHLAALASGYRQLASVGLLDDVFAHMNTHPNSQSYFLHVFRFFHRDELYEPAQLEAIARVMDLVVAHLPTEHVADALYDETAVQLDHHVDDELMEDDATGRKTATRGSLFYRNFASVVHRHVASELASFAPIFVERFVHRLTAVVLRGMLTALRSDKRMHPLRNKVAAPFTRLFAALCDRWLPPTAAIDYSLEALGLLDLFYKIEFERAHIPAAAIERLASFASQMLLDPRIGLDDGATVIALLPLLLGRSPAADQELLNTLQAFVQRRFPTRSSDHAPGTAELAAYIACIDRILECMVASGHTAVFEVVMNLCCREKEGHVHEPAIRAAMVQYFSRPVDCLPAINMCMSKFLSDALPSFFRSNVATIILFPALTMVSVATATSFFCTHIRTLCATITERLPVESAPNYTDQLFAKRGAAALLEAMYTRLPPAHVHGPGAAVNLAYLAGAPASDKGNELTKVLCASTGLRGLFADATTDASDLRRKMHCAAFNAISALLMATQDQEKFFAGFLFKETPAKGERPLDNLIDPARAYTFPVEFDKGIQSRFTKISLAATGARPAARRPTQMLLGSSLADELMGPSYIFTPNSDQDGADRATEGVSETVLLDEETLELDDLNSHECMVMMMRLMDFLVKLPKDDPVEMPGWMKHLHVKFLAPDTKPNIKLFIARLIVNRPKVFQPHGREWTKPLLYAILLNERDKENPFNSFVSDVSVVLMTWAVSHIIPDSGDAKLAGAVVDFLLRNCKTDSGAVLRNRINIIRLLAEKWKPLLQGTQPSFPIFANFSHSDAEGKGNLIGIHMLSAFVHVGYPPYELRADNHGVDKMKWFEALTANLGSKSAPVHRTAALVLGMALRYFAREFAENDGPIHTMVRRQLTAMLSPTPEHDRFLTCLHFLSREESGHPAISDEYIERVLFMLPAVNGQFKKFALDILASHGEAHPALFTKLRTLGLQTLFGHRDAAIQSSAIKLMKKLVLSLSAADVIMLLEILVKYFPDNTNATCRQLYFEFLINLYDAPRLAEESAEAMQARKDVHGQLLLGLADENAFIREKLFEFWDNPLHLSDAVCSRVNTMFSSLYSPSVENSFLQSASQLLLSLVAKSPEFDRPLFEAPLTASDWKAYSIDASLRTPVFATPLFAATQLGTAQGTQAPMAAGRVRTTQQELAFSQTQTQDPAANILLFKPTTVTPSAFFPRGPADSGVGQSSQAAVLEDISSLKRRFVRSTPQDPQSHQFWARIAHQKKLRVEAFSALRARKRFEHVTMLREYRIGELPDIQIKHKDFVRVLQAVCLLDGPLAHTFLGAFLDALCKFLQGASAPTDAATHLEHLRQNMTRMSDLVGHTYAPFVSFLHDACVRVGVTRALPLRADHVTLGAIASKSFHSGIVLLEHQLLVGPEVAAETAAKRARMASGLGAREALWYELARLNQLVGDDDVLRGIFRAEVQCKPLTQQAIDAEAQADYRTARVKYQLGLYPDDAAVAEHNLDDVNVKESQFWEDALGQCLKQLGEWDSLSNATLGCLPRRTETAAPDPDTIWSRPAYVERFLDNYLQSMLHLAIGGEEAQKTALVEFVERALRQTDRAEVLENKYSLQLAATFMLAGQSERALFYSLNAADRFRADWAALHPLMAAARLATLQRLQPLVDIQDTLSFLSDDAKIEALGPVRTMLTRWRTRMPSPDLDELHVWHMATSVRALCLDRILQAYRGRWATGGGDGTALLASLSGLIAEEKAHMALKVAEVATARLCPDAAIVELKKVEQLITSNALPASIAPAMRLAQTLTVTRLRLAVAEGRTVKTVKSLSRTLINLRDQETSGLWAPDASGRVHRAVPALRACRARTQRVLVRMSLGTIDADESAAILQALNASSISSAREQMLSEAFSTLKSICEPGARDKSDEALMELYAFCDECLRGSLLAASRVMFDQGELAANCVSSVLRAMCAGQTKALAYFPRTLQLLAAHPTCGALFVDEAAHVPTWMFVRWINQIVALLDKPVAPRLHPIVERLAAEFPSVLCYPLLVSSDQFRFHRATDPAAVFVARIKAQVVTPEIERFIEALLLLTDPEHAMMDWVKGEMEELLTATPRDKAAIRASYAAIKQTLLDPSNKESVIRAQYAGRVGAATVAALGEHGDLLERMTPQQLSQTINKLKDTPVPKGVRAPSLSELKTYSSYLSTFQGAHRLEVPGLYDGSRPPQRDAKVWIENFAPDVLVLTSIRRPKRITIRASNEKTYMYLVKGGEDLRLDQRIEQLFVLMNTILAQDPACAQRALSIRTYTVLPMSPRVGVIEWVQHSRTLKDVITGQLPEHKKDVSSEAHSMHQAWIDRLVGAEGRSRPYPTMMCKATSELAMAELEKKQRVLPPGLLQSAIRSWSVCAEGFIAARARMARSLATLSIAQYLLGVGDRHLSNFMIDTTSGEMVGIDFGHAFGSATQFLPVPELVPFRLTKQLQDIIRPLSREGMLTGSMIYVMAALQASRDVLLSTMDVFINEPLLDWTRHARLQNLKQKGAPQIDVTGFASEKIRIASRKLSCANPSHLTVEELRLGHAREAWFDTIVRAVLGTDHPTRRGSVGAQCADVAEQVMCLVDQASDPALLGRAWAGWEPWV
eukprot:m.132741 g.132741  ORF g.132741 m.132741 type:complete len:3967 (+) comp14817_c0_seq1:97-11997(+)